MNRFILFLAFACSAATVTAPEATAQESGQLLSREVARTFGLERMWFTQAAVDAGRGQIQHVTQHISNTDARFIYEVVTEKETVQYTSTDLDAFGVPLGQEGAKRKADKLATVLKNQGKTAEVVEHSIPIITLALSTDRGSIDLIDAETGKRFWSAHVGDPDHPTSAPAIDDYHVAVVNGSFVHLFDRQTGELLWRRKTVSTPGAGPALNQRFVFVPMFNGALESYPVADPTRAPGIYRGVGRALVQPAVTRRSVVWPTNRGYMYVAPADRVGVRFRVEAKKTIVASPAHAGRNLYIPSIDGYIYCVDELTGGMLWTISIGESLSRQPVAVGDRLYVPSVNKNLYCLSLEDGMIHWSAAGIDQVLTVGTDRVYCVGTGENLVALSLETGSVMMSSLERLPEFRITNTASNRLFLATPRGLLQGLREIDEPLPIVHFPAEKQGQPGTTPTGEEASADENPFGEDAEAGAEENPFGEDAEMPADEGADPGDTEDAGADENPFGP